MKFKKVSLEPLSTIDKHQIVRALGLNLFEYRFIEKRKQAKLVDCVWHECELFPTTSFSAAGLETFPSITFNHLYETDTHFIGDPLPLWQELFPYPLGAIRLLESDFRAGILDIRPESTASALFYLREAIDQFEKVASGRELAVLRIEGQDGLKVVALQFHRGRRLRVGVSPVLAQLAVDFPDALAFEREVRAAIGASSALFHLRLVADSDLFAQLTRAFKGAASGILSGEKIDKLSQSATQATEIP